MLLTSSTGYYIICTREFSISTNTSIISISPNSVTSQETHSSGLSLTVAETPLEPMGRPLPLCMVITIHYLPSRWNHMFLQGVRRILPDCMVSHPLIQDSSSGIYFVTTGWEIIAFLPAFLDAWSVIVYGKSVFIIVHLTQKHWVLFENLAVAWLLDKFAAFTVS